MIHGSIHNHKYEIRAKEPESHINHLWQVETREKAESFAKQLKDNNWRNVTVKEETKTLLIKRSFYDNVWNCPLFDVKIKTFGKRYTDKYVEIKVDIVKESPISILCYVSIVNDRGDEISLFVAYPAWIPKSVIKGELE